MLDEPVPLFGNDGAVLGLSREQATEKLGTIQNAMHPPPPIKPEDAQDARARLEVLSKDAGWSRALMRGDPAATKQFNDLIAAPAAGDDVSDAAAGIVPHVEPIFETTTGGQLPRRDVAKAVASFREDFAGDPGRTRTCDQQLRRLLL